MRFVLYNLRYGTGGRRRLPWSGYFGPTTRTLGDITGFLRSLHPDIVGLVEADSGSYRSKRLNQVQTVAEALGHYHTYRSKYREGGLARRIPVLNKQVNAFLTRDTVTAEAFHYFNHGIKRLVIELDLGRYAVFLVHLSVRYRVRQRQLGDLYELVKRTRKPHIVAGDFNALWGDHEIHLFLAATGLANPNLEGVASFPSWAPRRQLDFVLHSPEIQVRSFSLPSVMYSDHLPIVFDFDVK